MLHKDEWLCEYFDGGAYAYKAPFDAREFPAGFFYAKVVADNILDLRTLCAQGFDVVETLVTFKQQRPMIKKDTPYNIRLSKPEDRDGVVEIARDAFVSSRLYTDPDISNDVASKIKADWVDNFYKGARGDAMIVAQDDDGRIMGFLLLIGQVIDLIAVSKKEGQKGVASAMIAFANEEVGLLSAGTQIINAPSLALYQKCGFSLKNAEYVLHRHYQQMKEI